MKLSEYLALCEEGMEVTVFDTDLDIEVYFYADPIKDDFDKAVSLIAQCVDVVKIQDGAVTVNFWAAIEKARPALIDGDFYDKGSSVESMVSDVDPILAGNLSEKNTLEWAEIIYRSVMQKEPPA